MRFVLLTADVSLYDHSYDLPELIKTDNGFFILSYEYRPLQKVFSITLSIDFKEKNVSIKLVSFTWRFYRNDSGITHMFKLFRIKVIQDI